MIRGSESKSLSVIRVIKLRTPDGIVASACVVPENSGPSAASAADRSLLPDSGVVLRVSGVVVSVIGIDLGSSRAVAIEFGWTGVRDVTAVGGREFCPFGDMSGNALPTVFTTGVTVDETAGRIGPAAFVRSGTALGIGALTPSCSGFDPPRPVSMLAPIIFGVFLIDAATGSLPVTVSSAFVRGASGVSRSGNSNPTDGSESADTD